MYRFASLGIFNIISKQLVHFKQKKDYFFEIILYNLNKKWIFAVKSEAFSGLTVTAESRYYSYSLNSINYVNDILAEVLGNNFKYGKITDGYFEGMKIHAN